MDITFTVKITEDGIPQLMGLLAKMWDNPNPTAGITVEKTQEGKTVTVKSPDLPEDAAKQVADELQNAKPVFIPAPAPAPAPVVQAAPVTVAQIQAAAGIFMDAAPQNMGILQGILAELGVQALPQLSAYPDKLQAFAARLREHGVTL